MSLSARQNLLQTYQLILYGRALHPEHMALKARRVVRHADYELEAWVMPGQHALRFEHKGLCCTEYVTDQDRNIPTAGIITSHLCATEKDYEHKFQKDAVVYLSTVQTETLPEAIYATTFDELMDFGRQNAALVHLWEDQAGRCLSMIDIQRLNSEVHAQCYHMVASAGLVLRTSSLFELTQPAAMGEIEVKTIRTVTKHSGVVPPSAHR